MPASTPDLPPAAPAATLVLLREAAGRAPDLLFVERARAMAFAGGALAFPGGRVDPGDRALAAGREGDLDDIAARIAAVREMIEETGLAVALSPSPSAAELEGVRAALHADAPFGVALAAAGLTLDLAALLPFARWRPDHVAARRFDTRFYLARSPAGAPDPVVDGTENVHAFWASAQSVLDEADAGRARLIFPTRRNLERLARFASFEEAAADAARHPPRLIAPWIETRAGVPHLCIPDDLGYPVTSEAVGGAMRG